jgi:hypothetical protein
MRDITSNVSLMLYREALNVSSVAPQSPPNIGLDTWIRAVIDLFSEENNDGNKVVSIIGQGEIFISRFSICHTAASALS